MTSLGEALDASDPYVVGRTPEWDSTNPEAAVDPLLLSTPARRLAPIVCALPNSRRPPLLAGAITALIGYVTLLAATVLFGFLLLEVVLPGWVSRTDQEANLWLASRRTPAWDALSALGSGLAETFTVVAVCIGAAVLLAWRRRWYATAFLAVAISVEALVYLGTVLVVDRPRPHVVRLEDLGDGASYPSGHTAAAVVTYVGIAMVVGAGRPRRWVRAFVVTLAVAAPVAVAVARVYRGMHHPIDVVSGALLGIGCLGVALLTVLVAEAAARCRSAETDP